MSLRRLNPNFLFDGDDFYFKKFANSCTTYGEYGCGKSSKWVIRNTKVNIISIETDKKWAEKVLENISHDDRMNLRYVDCGPVRKWGKPINSSKKENYIEYCKSMWSKSSKPDFVLIDGRFRVCCFLISIKSAEEGTKIIFDDYIDRSEYHVVEKILKPSKIYGRQAIFTVPKFQTLDTDKINELINRSKYQIL